jgi:hypothetical protein
MSFESIVYGFITEAWTGKSDWIENNSVFVRHNNLILAGLTENDSWPPLAKNLFSLSTHEPHGPNGNFRGRIIGIAGKFKQIEDDWGEWLNKFENVLKQLYWEKAKIHLITGYTSPYEFNWELDTKQYEEHFLSREPTPPTTWKFEGPFRKFR